MKFCTCYFQTVTRYYYKPELNYLQIKANQPKQQQIHQIPTLQSSKEIYQKPNQISHHQISSPMTTQQPQNLSSKIQPQTEDTSTISTSPVKVDKQIIKEKKKKTQALKNFLTEKKQSEIVAPTRKKSDQQTQDVQLQGGDACKVCNKNVMKKKNCGFCNFVSCNDHMRKKRKHPKSGKFVRVCDDCEDKHLFQKYMKTQIKAEQALQMQEMIIASKHQELQQVLNGKRTKLQLLTNKRNQIDQQRRVNDARLAQNENQVRNKQRKLQSKFIQLQKLEKQITQMQKVVPRSLQQDFKALTDQNQKITKELVKYEKLCQEALKSKSKKEKEMYDMYYNWEDKQLIKQSSKGGKNKDDCAIY